jgi:hypothetical protein
MTKMLWMAAVLFLAIKVLLLAIFGTIYANDTPIYAEFADAILKSHHWLNDADLASSPLPPTALRVLGYPAVIAGAKLLAGSSWFYPVVGLQVAVSIGVSVLVFYFGLSLDLPPKWAFIAALACATSMQMLLDQTLMTDSLNASAIIVAVIVFLIGGKNGEKVHWWQTVVSGLLLVVAFLMREILPFTLVSIMPLFLIRCAVVKNASRFLRFVPFIAVCLPLYVAQQGYELWNWHRTGERFVTTITQVNAVMPLINASKNGTDMFTGDTPIDREARRLVKNDVFGDALLINESLFKEGYLAPEAARMALEEYKNAWRTHPLAMLNLIRIATSEKLLKLALRPITSVCDMFDWIGKPACFDYRTLYRKLFHHASDMTLNEVAVFTAITIQNTLSIIISALFYFAIPALLFLAWRDGTLGSDWLLLNLAGFWAFFVGWYLIHTVIFFNERYMMPAMPFMIIGGIAAGLRLDALRRTRAAVAS